MENCELCNKEFEHDTTTAYYYKVRGECLCFECLEKKETQQETKDDCRGME